VLLFGAGALACLTLFAQAAPPTAPEADPPTPPEVTAPTVPEATGPTVPEEVPPPEHPPVSVVIRQGETPEGGDGATVSGLGIPTVDSAGRMAFGGYLDDGAKGQVFVWRDGGVVWRSGSARAPRPKGISPQIGLDDEGGYIFQTRTGGKDALWSHHGLLLRAGEPAPGLGPETTVLLSRRTMMTADGTAYWISEFRDAPGAKGRGRALYRSAGATRSATEVVLRTDGLVDGLKIARPWGLGFAYEVSPNGEHLAQLLKLLTDSAADDDALWIDGKIALREGVETTGGERWKRFSQIAINDRGDYLVGADTDAPDAIDATLVFNGDIALREGDTLDGLELTTQASVLALALDNGGRAAHLWSAGGFGPEYLFFACDVTRLDESVLLLAAQ
jgi:hypothetical protein